MASRTLVRALYVYTHEIFLFVPNVALRSFKQKTSKCDVLATVATFGECPDKLDIVCVLLITLYKGMLHWGRTAQCLHMHTCTQSGIEYRVHRWQGSLRNWSQKTGDHEFLACCAIAT